MFHSKQDVDRHVNEVFKNIKSEYQRNLKCYQIAKLYYKFRDYKSAIKYINRYILSTANSAVAHKLLGECYLGINLKVKALDSFKTSLELNGNQHDLVLKVCTLLMDPEVSSVTPKATYWLERAESLFPENPVVFQLKEHLLKSNLDGKQDSGQLEKLILSEVSARPADVTVRIRLLNFFLDSKRYKIAYQHALEIEERNTFSTDLRWYDCLCNLVQVYEKAISDLPFSFFIRKVIFFDRRADLFMEEFQNEVKTLPECSSALFAFDQSLHALSKIEVPQEETYFFKEFMKHMRAQVSFHLATLALKRAKKEYGIWPKAFRTASPLLLQATQNTMDLEGAWYSMWIGKNKMEREVKQLNKSATLRVSQAGHVLLAWSQSKGPSFLEKVSQFCGGKWQQHVYQDIFYNREHQQATATSHFINDPFFTNVPMRLLSEAELVHFDEASQTAYPDSLHHLVWLGLAYCNTSGYLNHNFRCTVVPDLQFTVNNLSQFGPETLNQLDVDAFLYASVLCAKSAMLNVVSSDRPARLPISISDELCSVAQAEWWVDVYKTYKNQTTGNIASMRLNLRKGIETIRVFGHHGLHIKVIVMLAKLFQERAAKNKNPNELSGLEERANLYWTAAIPILEKLERRQVLRDVPNRLFDYRGKDLTQNEIKGYLEEGRLFNGCRLMKQGRHEQAIEAFQSLKSPYASFYQGLIYEKLASEEMNHQSESITSENRSQHIILLTRARDAYYLTSDRLRCPSVDPNHPLNAQLQDHLEQIEKQLAMIDPDTPLNRNEDSESDETDTALGPLSPDVDENLDSSFNVYNTNNFINAKNHFSSRGLRQNNPDKQLNIRFEARPSPERLDAQLRHLVQANSNGLHSIFEQLKEIKSVMQIELKDLGCVTRDLLSEMKKLNDKIESSKKDAIKPEDLFELREEDYEELSQLSQPYTPSYSQNFQSGRQITSTQGPSTVTYGTPVPSPIPPVPSVPPVMPNSEIPLPPTPFFPGAHPVPPIDPNLLLYQILGYYAQGMPGYADNQNVPDSRGTGIQKGPPFAKNSYRAPDTVPTTSASFSKSQPPNVVITSSDTLPAFSSAGTPAMSVTIPPQHIRGLTPAIVQKPNQSQVHPFQIQMPLQAQVVKESPAEKLDTILPTSLASTNVVQTAASSVKPSLPTTQTSITQTAPQTTPSTEASQIKSTYQVTKPLDDKTKWCSRPDSEGKAGTEGRRFEFRGKLSVWTGKKWKDRGSVFLKIFPDEATGKVRLIMFEEDFFKMCADHYITPEMSLESLKLSENGWIWSVPQQQNNLQPDEDEDLPEKYRVKFVSFDESKYFENAFNEGRKVMKGTKQNVSSKVSSLDNSKSVLKSCKICKGKVDGNAEKCSACETKEKNSEKSNLGGFTFVTQPIVNPPVLKLNEEDNKKTTKPSPFTEFSFSSVSKNFSPSDSKAKGEGVNVGGIFSAVKPDPNSFKKDNNFKGFEGRDSLVFSHLNKPEASVSKAKGTGSEKTGTNEDNEDGDEEFVPTAEFTPVVDLPDLVDVKTGEENDKVLFQERAKLLRFDTKLKEWKERGVGDIKMLLNEESGKVRLIMRRELVLKVCCNHYLDENMEFKRMKKSEKALTWYAQDYSEGDLKAELFALRFKTPKSMIAFESVLQETQSKLKNGRMEGTASKEPKDKKPDELKPLSELFKPKVGSWECDACFLRNEESSTKCVSCETPKPGSKAALSSGSTPKESSLGKGITFPSTNIKFNFGIPQSTQPSNTTTASTTSKSIFGTPQSSMKSTNSSTVSTSAPTFTFGIPQSTAFVNPTSVSTSASNFTFGILQNTTPSTGFSFSLPQITVAQNNSTILTSTTTTSSPATKASLDSQQSKLTSYIAGSVPGFPVTTPKFGTTVSPAIPITTTTYSLNLGTSQTTAFVTSAPTNTFAFNNPPSKTEEANPSTEKPFQFSITKSDNLKTGSGTVQHSFSFSKPVEKADKFEFSVTSNKLNSPKSTQSPKDKNNATSEDSDEEPEEDNGDHIIVKPLVPLPDKVAVHTGEEDEDIVYEKRAKLFRYKDKEWKERGIGDVKILKHKTTNKIRLLMRRETILKVCLNHYVTPDIEFSEKDEKTWFWSAADFSEEEVQYTTFAIRFKTSEIAQEFKKALDDAINNKISFSIKTENSEKSNEPTPAMKNFTFAVPNVPKSETPKSSSDDDVVVVYENKVTPEQREKAMSLHLPPNFYAYLQAPDCPGCPGCDKEDPPVSCSQESAPASTKPIFGTTSWGSLNFGNFGKTGASDGKLLFTFAGNQANTNWKPKGSSRTDVDEENKEQDDEDDDDDDEGDENEDDDDDEDEDDEVEHEDEDDDDDGNLDSEYEEVSQEEEDDDGDEEVEDEEEKRIDEREEGEIKTPITIKGTKIVKEKI